MGDEAFSRFADGCRTVARAGLLLFAAALAVAIVTSVSRAATPVPAPLRHADGAGTAPAAASPSAAAQANGGPSVPPATPTPQPTNTPTPQPSVTPHSAPAPTATALPATSSVPVAGVVATPRVIPHQNHPQIPTRPPGSAIPGTVNPMPTGHPQGTVPVIPSVTPITRADVIRGMEYTSWGHGEYAAPASDVTLAQEIVPLGANWIAPIVTCYQATITSTTIDCTGDQTPTDADLQHLITEAHALGFKVMLKPMLDLSNDPDHWRGDISMGSNQTKWNAWFASYTTYVTHYAALAQSTGADMFSVGCELGSTNDPSIHDNTAAWRGVVQAVRASYSGPLTYSANPGEEINIAWWDALDYIGVDAYYALTDKPDPSVAELEAAWADPVQRLIGLVNQFHRPVLFTEVGYQSQQGTNITPWYTTSNVLDLQEQANCYTALFEVFRNYSWWRGVFWWSVMPHPNQGGSTDLDFTPINKPAQEVVLAYYGGPRTPVPLPSRHPDGTYTP